MKKTLVVALLTFGVVASALSQGTVVFNNLNSAAGLKSPIYGPNPANLSEALSGNTANGLPAGTTVYAGPLLAGSTYMAQLWAFPAANAAESSLVGAANPTTVFRTGNAAGFVTQITSTLAGVPLDAPAATLQLRVWDTAVGATYADAVAANGGFGKSGLFNLTAIGGSLNPPPNLIGLQSFNIVGIIPEPSSFALAGLGAAALLIFRRRK